LFLFFVAAGYGAAWNAAWALDGETSPVSSVARVQPAEQRVAAAVQTDSGGGQGWNRKVAHTTMFGAKIKTEVERKGSDLRGVVYVTPPFSKTETYHFTGKIEGDQVWAAHSDGHRFRGKVTPDRRVVGEVTTNKGRRFPLDVKMP
jgi:hypothetical protein